MKRCVIFLLAMAGLAGGFLSNADGGSAVAFAPPSHLVSMFGHPKDVSIQRALEEGRRRYGPNVKLLAATDVTGYGAVAIARHPNGQGSIIGVALGMRSATEADTVAIQKCLRAGGTHAEVRWAWRG
jgi:hypothetical protein